MHAKEITILVGLHKGNSLMPNDTLFYRFFIIKNGEMQKISYLKKKQNSRDLFENILTAFLNAANSTLLSMN